MRVSPPRAENRITRCWNQPRPPSPSVRQQDWHQAPQSQQPPSKRMPRETGASFRVGVGYDSHRFSAGRALKLGGVSIQSDVGLAGHSDADAVCHALTDAILGAAALGDIGEMFPDTDEANRDR